MGMDNDFQPPRGSVGTSKQKFKVRRWVVLILLVMFAGMSLLLMSSGSSSKLEAREVPIEVAAPVISTTLPVPVYEEIKNTVPAGSSITALLGEYFTAQEIYNLNRRSHDIFPFTKICAEHPYRIRTTDGEFSSFTYEIDAEEQLVISCDADQINMERQPIIYDVVTELIQGTIKTSLFNAIAEINESPELAYVLADIFGWDINFILDLRVGDTFQALVQKRFREGHLAGYGKVLAAEFVNQKQTFKAIRFQDGDQKVSFYNEKGENVRKAFLKAPLSFTRISSGFTLNRFHPILKSWKAHPAIDYVAPVGTPIKTVGDGSIYRIGYTKGNGNFIEVRHSNGYATIYLHMKGFARGLKKGTRVSQGQVIGYLGGTGMATGPHLCFRMRHHGAPVNPTKLKAPASKSVSQQHLAAFQALSAPLLVHLNEKRIYTQVAKLDLSQSNPAADQPQ